MGTQKLHTIYFRLKLGFKHIYRSCLRVVTDVCLIGRRHFASAGTQRSRAAEWRRIPCHLLAAKEGQKWKFCTNGSVVTSITDFGVTTLLPTRVAQKHDHA